VFGVRGETTRPQDTPMNGDHPPTAKRDQWILSFEAALGELRSTQRVCFALCAESSP